jgi:hypothetical protein
MRLRGNVPVAVAAWKSAPTMVLSLNVGSERSTTMVAPPLATTAASSALTAVAVAMS